MPRLPRTSGQDLIKLLHSSGDVTLGQRGSHIRLRKVTAVGEHNITVPDHKVIAKGTLNDILAWVTLWNGISKDELLAKLG
jgi:predicted RNA binding protein YcfA (HicA-like mRNA interferase family)